MQSDKELVGVVAVDSGCIVIGDPCYVDIAQPAEQEIFSSGGGGQIGLCVAAPSFGGDGIFPVYAQRGSDGNLETLTIHLKRTDGTKWTAEQLEGKEFFDAHAAHYADEQRKGAVIPRVIAS
jgi:hypothetical protein